MTWPMLVAGVQAESGSDSLTARREMRSARRRCVLLFESLGRPGSNGVREQCPQRRHKSAEPDTVVLRSSYALRRQRRSARNARVRGVRDHHRRVAQYLRNVYVLPCASSCSPSLNAGDAVSVAWPAQFYTCPFWPVRAVERYQGPFNKTLANKVMVISNTVCTLFSFTVCDELRLTTSV